MVKFLECAMLNHPVGYAQDFECRAIMMRCGEFQNGRTKATGYRSIFDGDDPVEFPKNFMEHELIQRFCKAHVIVGGIKPLGPQLTYRSGYKIAGVAE